MSVIKCSKIRHPIHGTARKAALTFLILSTFGWTIFVVFFGLTTLEETVESVNCVIQKTRLDGAFVPHWCFLVVGPILYTSAMVALILNREGYLQMIINFFVAIYFICGGAIIYTDWIIHDGKLKYLFEFGACCTSLITLALYLIVAPIFKSLLITPVSVEKLPDDVNINTVDPNPSELNRKSTMVAKNEAYNSRATLKLDQTLSSSTNQYVIGTEQTTNQPSIPITANEEVDVEEQDEYAVPDEIINTADDTQDEEDYVVNEPFYDGQEDDHGEQMYEDMEGIQDNSEYEEVTVH